MGQFNETQIYKDGMELLKILSSKVKNITPKQSAPIVLYIGKLMQQTGGLRKKYII